LTILASSSSMKEVEPNDLYSIYSEENQHSSVTCGYISNLCVIVRVVMGNVKVSFSAKAKASVSSTKGMAWG